MKAYYSFIIPALFLGVCSCAEQQKMELETYTVEPTTMSEVVTATGTMESVTQVDVGTQVTGIIDKLYADFNSVVKKGELLAELDKTTLAAELQSADANVASAKSTYEYNRCNYERDRKLHDEKLISDYEFQTSRNSFEVAKQNYEKAQADRVRAAKNLNYTEIYSPMDGVVISREVEVGQTVVSSMNVANLYVIADLDNMQVVGNVDEADIGQVKEGQHVTFTVDAYTDDVFEGTVSQVRLNPTTTSNVVTYEVIVTTSNPDHKLIPGMTANLTIYTLELKDVLTVPMKALKFNPQQGENGDNDKKEKGELEIVALKEPAATSVWVVRDNKLVQTSVTLGVDNSINQEITSGLKRGDKVALQYHQPTVAEKEGKTEENPFMPKRPGANKKGNNK